MGQPTYLLSTGRTSTVRLPTLPRGGAHSHPTLSRSRAPSPNPAPHRELASGPEQSPEASPAPGQVLSDGMLSYLGARKLADTPFPFPYAQLNAGFCLIILCLFPFVVAAKARRSRLARRRPPFASRPFPLAPRLLPLAPHPLTPHPSPSAPRASPGAECRHGQRHILPRGHDDVLAQRGAYHMHMHTRCICICTSYAGTTARSTRCVCTCITLSMHT